MERITSVAIVATADGRMVGGATTRIVATGAWAGITASLIDAGPVRGTLSTGHALGLAVGRTAQIVWQAGTDRTTTDHVASAKEATGRGSAWIFGQWQIHI